MKTALIAFIVSVVTAVLLGETVIPLLKKLKLGQNILSYVKEHDYKSGTPTMGGVIFVFAAVLSFIIFAAGKKSLALMSVTIGIAYMSVGFIDDFIKVGFHRNEGLNPLQKTIFELVIAIVVAFYGYKKGITKLYLPFSDYTVDLKCFFVPFCVIVFFATTNSVNLTDGLDGLAGGVSYVCFLAFATLIKLQTVKYSGFYVNADEYGNLALLCVVLAGGLIGFLLFNTYKAKVFMGDTGSLSIGGFIASIGIFSGNSLFIPLIGITFAASSISVILQVIHFKRTGKRIFLMAPLHHHFQHKGYSESKIVFAYKLVTLLASLGCLIMYV
ncbi:MAG: phospho-N-acetylmuramoyl-pentapeptide-transferase [Clostridia bacterium]|nr:phospho-N-acetylmuramoyl-pentapeptide-transferase [Clostridia bacterium]